MSVAIESVPVLDGVYREVKIGFTLDNGRPLWSVDIATHIDGVTVVGNGETLEAAAADAQSRLVPADE